MLCRLLTGPLNGHHAYQSTTTDNHVVSLAIDGNIDINNNGLCTLTNNELRAWWSVDLGEIRRVYQIVIFTSQSKFIIAINLSYTTLNYDCCKWGKRISCI